MGNLIHDGLVRRSAAWSVDQRLGIDISMYLLTSLDLAYLICIVRTLGDNLIMTSLMSLCGTCPGLYRTYIHDLAIVRYLAT